MTSNADWLLPGGAATDTDADLDLAGERDEHRLRCVKGKLALASTTLLCTTRELRVCFAFYGHDAMICSSLPFALYIHHTR